MTFKSILITLLVIAALIVLGGGIYLWYQSRGIQSLDIKLEFPDEIAAGAPFDLKIEVSNNSQNILEDAELFVELPEDVVFLGSSADKTLTSKNLGNLGPGSITEESFKLLALGGENTVKEVKASVLYLPASLGSKFEKSVSAVFSVLDSTISLDVALPEKVFSSQDFEVKISYKNVSDSDLNDLKLKVVYPQVFNFKSASLEPDLGNNIWEFGDLRSNSEGVLTIKGQMIGPDDSFFEFKSSLEAGFLGRSYKISEKSASIGIAESPLSLNVSLNNGANFIAYLGSELNYTLNFINNTQTGLRDAVIKAKLVGAMFDFGTLNSNASLSAVSNTLTWNPSNTPSLSVIQPGASGSVNFKIKAKPNYPIVRLSDKNFVLKVEAQIESPTVPDQVSALKTLSVAKIETKVGGEINVDAKGLFRDAASGILNKGPWPPKVGEPTNFTLHWLVSSYGTDLERIELKAFLGPNVKVTGAITSNISSKPVYNDRTQELVWQIDKIQAGKGVITPAVEAVFQVEVTPSISQVGSNVILLKETSVTATDSFTGTVINDLDVEVTTSTLDDPTINQLQGIVVQ